MVRLDKWEVRSEKITGSVEVNV